MYTRRRTHMDTHTHVHMETIIKLLKVKLKNKIVYYEIVQNRR